VYRKPRPFWEGERSLELFSKALETDRHLLPIDWRRAQPFRSTADAGKTARGTGATLLKRQAKCITELLLSHLKRISLHAHPASASSSILLAMSVVSVHDFQLALVS
jgi:hypothetical protein